MDLFNRLPAKARILFIRLRSMGDCLLLTSPVSALKQEFPGFRVSVLVEDRFAACFSNNPDFENVLSLENKFQAPRILALRRFNAIINLHGGPTSLAYSCMAWGRRVGAEHYRFARLYNGLFPSPDPAAHTAESTLNSFRWMGLRADSAPALRYEVQPRERAEMQRKFGERPYVVIHPAALMGTKRWDPDRFAQIGRKLIQRQFNIVLTCGPGEETSVSKVAKDLPSSIIMLGLNIPQLAELIRGARLFIGNDSGPMHLAAAVGTPTVAIWGSSDSRRWRPWRVEHRVIQNEFECNPCPGYRCLVADSPLCIESVTVQQVDNALDEILKVHAD
jgi:ADP-heptose:LPS heptosyltransferase